MELRHLRYFAALAEHFNFTRAAEATHVTQSTLSHQIKMLEDEVGYALFDRSGRKVLLTEKGTVLLPHVLRVLGEMDAGIRALSATSTVLSGRVRLGAIITVPFTLLAYALAHLVEAHPHVAVSLSELPGDVIEYQVRSRALDLGIVYRPKDTLDLWFEPVYRDELVFVVGPRHPLANRRGLRLAELHQQRIGVLSGVETRTMMETYFRMVAAEPVIVADVNKVPPLVGMVTSCNIGVLVPRRSAALFPGVRAISLEYPTPVMELGLILNSTAELSLEATKLAHLIRTADKTLEPPEAPAT
jgi:LysR family transcriptional regulator, cyn operon transcriptional activator